MRTFEKIKIGGAIFAEGTVLPSVLISKVEYLHQNIDLIALVGPIVYIALSFGKVVGMPVRDGKSGTPRVRSTERRRIDNGRRP